ALLYGKHDLDGASASFRKAIEVVPNYAQAHWNLGQVRARKGQGKEAAASLARAIELVPEDNWTAFQLGFVLAERGDLAAYQQYCKPMLSRWGKVTDPAIAERITKVCLLLPGGVHDAVQLTPLVKTAESAGEKHELYMWILFAQGLHDYRCGRFAE